MAKIALVTGGTGGIGRELNKRLVRDGYLVVAADMAVDPSSNGAAADDQPDGVVLHHINVMDQESVDACVAHCASLGEFKAIVNCAGILRHGFVEDITEEALNTVWQTNLGGAARVCKAASPHLNKGASIVNISSVTAWIGRMPGGSLYGASKAALEAFTRYLASELAPRGIRVNALAPGYIEVLPMSPSMRFIANSDNDEDAVKWLVSHVPMARMGQPAEMAGPVSFLLSEDASYVTGHVLLADGGLVTA
jgi:3-oxoacyl-[acyl-carrier protein] reductase